MKKYVFAKRTMHVFKREDGPFDESIINALDPRFITEGRVVCVEDDEPKLSEESKDKLAEIKADLADDGKLNYSNNAKKESPGRPKKKLFKKFKK